ncbi:MAG TPA: hypothetical protein DD979_02170 [Gammaproteobacteria bacterium]|nr:hypothetical protein [Gammaproteobacteria bacterium]
MENEFTPYIGLIHDLNTDNSVYVSASKAYVPQTAKDKNDKVLEPRTGSQVELGVKGIFGQRKANYQLAIFQVTDKNRAIADLTADENSANPEASIAGGEVRARGFEAEISGQVLDRLELVIGYTYTDTEQLKSDDPEAEGKPFATDAPEQLLRLWGNYAVSDQWSAALGAEYNSGTYQEFGDVRWEQGGFTTFSAGATYKLNEDVRFVLSGTNLTDKRYYSRVQGGGRQNYFGDPRQIKLSVEMTF